MSAILSSNTFLPRAAVGALALMGVVGVSAGARAQESSSLEKYAPPVVGVNGTGRIRASDTGTQHSAADRAKIIIPQVRGIVFVDRPGAVRKKAPLVDGIVIQGAADSVPANVKAAAGGFLGGALTLGSLDDLTKALVLAYRSADRPVVNVVVPEQEVTGGVLQILVVVGRLNEVRVEGATGATADALTGAIRLVRGEPISEGALLDDLRFLNRNPFRRVDAIYQPGGKYGQTDIVLQDTEDKPWTVYAGAESKGGRGPLGDARPFIGALESNGLGVGEVIGYQYTTDPSFYRLQSHVVSLTLPLPDRWQFQSVFGYTKTKADLGSGLNEAGSSTMVGGYFVAPLPHIGDFAQDFRFGTEYKSINNNLDFGGQTVTAGTPEILQAVIGYTGEGVTFGAKTRIDGTIYGSPGGLTSNDNGNVYQQLRGGARSEYVYAKGNIDNRWDLGGDWRFLSNVTGQISSANLLPTEQLVLGGLGSVRGFAYQDALVDSGVTANFTLYSPGYGLMRGLFGQSNGLVDQLRAYAFVDHGSGFYHAPLTQQANYVGLTGAGLGLTYEAAKYVNFDVGYGRHLQETGIIDPEKGRWHFRVVARY